MTVAFTECLGRLNQPVFGPTLPPSDFPWAWRDPVQRQRLLRFLPKLDANGRAPAGGPFFLQLAVEVSLTRAYLLR
ncbi:hypothetical protein [Actinophytocola sediminis]